MTVFSVMSVMAGYALLAFVADENASAYHTLIHIHIHTHTKNNTRTHSQNKNLHIHSFTHMLKKTTSLAEAPGNPG